MFGQIFKQYSVKFDFTFAYPKPLGLNKIHFTFATFSLLDVSQFSSYGSPIQKTQTSCYMIQPIPGACFSTVLKLFGRISGDVIVFASSN